MWTLFNRAFAAVYRWITKREYGRSQ